VSTATATTVSLPEDAAPSDPFKVPSLPQLGRRAVPQIIEGAVVPVALFVAMLQIAGLSAAIIVGLAWPTLAIVRRLRANRRVPAMIVLGAGLLVIRSVLALATGSAFLYFLQPILGTACLALAFLVSVPLDRPLAARFAADFCALPSHLLVNAHVHRFFRHISVLWAAVGFFNAAATLWLLTTESTTTFLMVKTTLSVMLTVFAVVVSTLWFRSSMTRLRVLALRG
jgi:hypothetical protein